MSEKSGEAESRDVDFPPGGIAVVIGAGGGIGSAVAKILRNDLRFAQVVSLGRSTSPAIDVTREDTIAAAAGDISSLAGDVRLVFDATGILHSETVSPEKSWRDLGMTRMAEVFAVNAFGPALLMKHFLPLLPGEGKSVFATLSARVGSIGDNGYGGWYSYRASKAALNQFVRTAAIELARRRKGAVCVALHPGTVDTRLSEPFSKSGLDVRPPQEAARDLLRVIDGLTAGQTGGFFDHRGEEIPW
ncbi:SDR family oxidoreductase [Rhizobiales bacterium]|uniref:SDR family NAD(P)-dependent oxidoreductase n=1 Tax=Hongsoonwoonella zoysiae TaxID=2821844 RepID=UPI001561155A|nr:SDR family oxidoreductase [Hongsoonwoonella zoysiae]